MDCIFDLTSLDFKILRKEGPETPSPKDEKSKSGPKGFFDRIKNYVSPEKSKNDPNLSDQKSNDTKYAEISENRPIESEKTAKKPLIFKMPQKSPK